MLHLHLHINAFVYFLCPLVKVIFISTKWSYSIILKVLVYR